MHFIDTEYNYSSIHKKRRIFFSSIRCSIILFLPYRPLWIDEHWECVMELILFPRCINTMCCINNAHAMHGAYSKQYRKCSIVSTASIYFTCVVLSAHEITASRLPIIVTTRAIGFSHIAHTHVRTKRRIVFWLVHGANNRRVKLRSKKGWC